MAIRRRMAILHPMEIHRRMAIRPPDEPDH
jgi:hypothetical protein